MKDTIDNWNSFFNKYNKNKTAIYFSIIARNKICNILNTLIFKNNKKKNIKICDFGTSDSSNKDSNPLLKFILAKKIYKNIYGLGLDEVINVKKRFKSINYLKIKKNKKLPFKKNFFDIIVSHAVFEHIGIEKQFIQNIKELNRIGKEIFISIPNRFFFIEHHTGIPFLSYLPKKIIYLIMKIIGYQMFTSEEGITFSSINDLKKILSKTEISKNSIFRFGFCGLGLGPFSSHIFVYIKKN